MGIQHRALVTVWTWTHTGMVRQNNQQRDRETDRQTDTDSLMWEVCAGWAPTRGRAGNREANPVKVLKVSLAELPLAKPLEANLAQYMSV